MMYFVSRSGRGGVLHDIRNGCLVKGSNIIAMIVGAIRHLSVHLVCGDMTSGRCLQYGPKFHTPVPGKAPFLFSTTIWCSREM